MGHSDDNMDEPEKSPDKMDRMERIRHGIKHHSEGEEITVTWAEERFSPISYNSFGVGPFSITTKVQTGETPEEAFARAYKFLAGQAQKAFVSKRDRFFLNYNAGQSGGTS